MNKYVALLGRELQGKTKVIGNKYLPQCLVVPPSITHGLTWECTWASAVRSRDQQARYGTARLVNKIYSRYLQIYVKCSQI